MQRVGRAGLGIARKKKGKGRLSSRLERQQKEKGSPSIIAKWCHLTSVCSDAIPLNGEGKCKRFLGKRQRLLGGKKSCPQLGGGFNRSWGSKK